MIVHDLKTWLPHFRPVWDGEKTFEIRVDDRGFQRGDLANLREWDIALSCECRSNHHDEKTCTRYTGRRILAEIGYVAASTPRRGNQPGFSGGGYVVFSLINVERIVEDLLGAPEFAAVQRPPSPAAMPPRIPTQRDP